MPELSYGKIMIIWNPVAGRDSSGGDRENLSIAMKGIDHEIREWADKNDPRGWTEAAQREGFDLIIAAGGDGTVCAVADGLARIGSTIPLAVFPQGSQNFLANELGYPTQPEEIVPWILSQKPMSCDIGYVKEYDRYFLISVSGGLHADIIDDTSREAKRLLGWLAYVYHGVPVLFRGNWYRLSMKLDGESRRWKSNAMVVLNFGSTMPGGKALPLSVSPFDGRMDVLVNRKGSFFDIVGLLAGRLLRRRFRLHRLAYRQVTRMVMTSNPQMSLQMDGESIGETPVSIEIRHRALRIVGVPQAPAKY
ncbi:MAG: diacylglycerol kinase family protein [Candidatus Fermentibacteraceae bacterium]